MTTTTPIPSPRGERGRDVLGPVGSAVSVLGTLGVFLGMHVLIAAAAGGFLLAVLNWFGG